jgi:hypothetical protein
MGTCCEVSVQAAEIGFLDAAPPADIESRVILPCHPACTWMWPPEPCAQVRILPGALADSLVIKPLSWPFPRCPPEASSPG